MTLKDWIVVTWCLTVLGVLTTDLLLIYWLAATLCVPGAEFAWHVSPGAHRRIHLGWTDMVEAVVFTFLAACTVSLTFVT